MGSIVIHFTGPMLDAKPGEYGSGEPSPLADMFHRGIQALALERELNRINAKLERVAGARARVEAKIRELRNQPEPTPPTLLEKLERLIEEERRA